MTFRLFTPSHLWICGLFLCWSIPFGFTQTPPSPVSPPSITTKLNAKQLKLEQDASKRINRLSDQLKSPFCPGKTLLTCTSSQAYDLRKEMKEMILDGKTDVEILDVLRGAFGEKLENPIQPWYTILIPFLPFVFGILIAIWIFSKWIKGSKIRQNEDQIIQEVDLSDEQKDRLTALMQDD
jgi:cytochrome c-type biogenesis protein CcmH